MNVSRIGILAFAVVAIAFIAVPGLALVRGFGLSAAVRPNVAPVGTPASILAPAPRIIPTPGSDLEAVAPTATIPVSTVDDGTADAPRIRETIAHSLDPNLGRKGVRLPRVTINHVGDVTVVFAAKSAPDAPTIRDVAIQDTLTVLNAVYHSPDVTRITTATVLGTFPVQGKWGSTREQVIIRATLKADRARIIGWDSLQPDELQGAVNGWWLYPTFAEAQGPGPTPTTRIRLTNRVDQERDLHDQIGVMLIHLNLTLHALNADEVGIARSQFKQFFDAWDNADEEELRPLYPAQYDRLDLAENRAENALVQKLPGQEDTATARSALEDLRSGLLAVSRDLESRLQTPSAGGI